jgi:hypothetical protein
MMRPAESLVRKDATASHGTSPPAWRSLPEPQMRAVLVVITYSGVGGEIFAFLISAFANVLGYGLVGLVVSSVYRRFFLRTE